MKNRWIISTVISSLIIGSISLVAQGESVAPKDQKILRIQKSVRHEAKIQKDHFKEASKEIINGLKKSFLATRALEENKIDEAKKSLKESIKLFETALKAEPKLGTIPIAQEINVQVFAGDAKELQHYLDNTIDLLKKHDTQEARAMLLPLEDEMVIATQALPVDAYLASTKEALKSLEGNQKEEALDTLITGMSLMEIDTVVIPIPLMVAEDLIVDASVLDKSKKEEAQKLLGMAQDELEKAVLLGYTQKHSPEYKALSDGIAEIQKEIKGKNVVEKLYENLKGKIHALLGQSRKDVVKEKAEEKVRAYQNKEAQKAVNQVATFASDAKKDENKTIK